jgi:hypothetical protein
MASAVLFHTPTKAAKAQVSILSPTWSYAIVKLKNPILVFEQTAQPHKGDEYPKRDRI